jgi:hypothetical protein
VTPREAMKKNVWVVGRPFKNGSRYDFFVGVVAGYAWVLRFDEPNDTCGLLTNWSVQDNWAGTDDLLDYDGYEEKQPPHEKHHMIMKGVFRYLA